LANPIQKNQFILDANSTDSFVQWCIDNRGQMISAFTCRKGAYMQAFSSGFLSDPAEAVKAYDRGETPWCLVPIMNDPLQKAEFLDFCYMYDSNPYVCGMGKDNLLAVGDII